MATARTITAADLEKDLVPFIEASRVSQLSSHRYVCNVHSGWSYGPAALGGFLISLVWEAVRLHFATTLMKSQQPETFAMHIEFLRPATPGEVVVHVKDVKLGKGTSTVGFSLIQAGKESCIGFATNCGNRAKVATVSLNLDYNPTPAPPPINFEAVLNGKDPFWIRYDVKQPFEANNQILENFIFVYSRQPLRVQGSKRIAQHWICPRLPQQKWTTSMLGILLDSAVPPPENFYPSTHNAISFAERAEENERLGKPSWIHPPWKSERLYVTINMTIEVKRQLPEEGEKWLMLKWHTREVVDGRFDADIEVWDPRGRLIANASSLWQLVDLSKTLVNNPTITENKQGTKQGKL